MSYIGNTNTTQAFTPAIDYFSGNGSTTAFTLSRPVASVAQVQVVVNNVAQNPSSAYTVSGNTITFTSAPLSGTNNIYVYYTSPITQVGTLTQNPVITGNLNFGSTGARITGDFSNATLANRVAFQSSTTNGATVVTAIPNGNSTQSFFAVHNSSDITNSSLGYIAATGLDTRIVSASTGTGTNLPLTFFTGGSERMRVDTSGNVGIGTSSPNKKLEVLGAGEIIRATSNNAAADQLISVKNNSGTADCSTNIFFADRYAASSYASSYIRGTTSGISALIFATGGTNFTNIYDAGAPTERMRIDSSGNLLIGTGGGSVPNGTSVYGSAFDDNGANTKRLRLASSVTTTIQLVSFYNPNGNVGNITTTASATAYATSSDYRLKNTIAPMTGALAKVQALKPVTYKWNADNSDGQGFIAHELAEVVPQCVIGEKDAVDDDGNPVYQGIDTSFLVATLTAAIQEQQTLITALTARIEALENK